MSEFILNILTVKVKLLSAFSCTDISNMLHYYFKELCQFLTANRKTPVFPVNY